jgi:Uma2 family endonuclease
MNAKTMMTVEEFDRLIEPDELDYELDEGELVEMTKPRYEPHNRIVRTISRVLDRYLDEHPIGDLLSADNLFVLGPATKRAPDLSFMSTGRMNAIKPREDIPGAPDLAIEVLSPNDAASAMRRKVKQYFAAGARLVWVVYPEEREIQVWRGDSSPVMLGENDTLTAPDLLHGFAVKIVSLS